MWLIVNNFFLFYVPMRMIVSMRKDSLKEAKLFKKLLSFSKYFRCKKADNGLPDFAFNHSSHHRNKHECFRT